tara:strand:- start:411 stop:1163 length:753 start_codon:yes stop_codon:yes gene_type:complete
MAQIKKEQLKKIIQKEYINVLKEVKGNEAHFNQVAYEHVIRSLIKEGILDEQLGIENAISSMMPGSNANKMRRALRPEEEEPQYGETWDDARTRMGLGAGGQPVNPEEEAAGPQVPEESGVSAPEQEPSAMPDVASLGRPALPVGVEVQLNNIGMKAHPVIRSKIIPIGNEVFSSLTREIGGTKSPGMIGKLTVAIIQSVVKGMNSTRHTDSLGDQTGGKIEHMWPERLADLEQAGGQVVSEIQKRTLRR